MVQQDVEFYASLGLAEFGPREQGQTEGDSGRVQREQLVLEAEPTWAVSADNTLTAEPVQHGPKQILVKCGSSVFIGVGESRPLGSVTDPQMGEFSKAAGQSIADFS